MQSTIIQVQEDMGDPTKWAAQSQEQQTSRYQVSAVLLILTVSTNGHKNVFFTRARQLGQDERQCRSYLTLARETVDMFHYLTEGCLVKEYALRGIQYDLQESKSPF